jgi:hypothetical protein
MLSCRLLPRIIGFAAILSAAFSLALSAPAAAIAGVSAERFARLTRGVNLSHWFSQIPRGEGYSHERFSTYDGAPDFALLAQAGFRHVRFPVEFEMFFDESSPGKLKPEFVSDFDRALDQILGAGLAVIIDWHARETTKTRLHDDEHFAVIAAQLWGAVARHVAGRDPERVFLETMNEPAAKIPLERWTAIQQQLVAAMREAAPRHTIIVTSNNWSGIGDLVKFTPLSDPNVVYNFHCYEPMAFTHQGAAWAGEGLRPIEGLGYPTDPANKATVLARVTDERARKTVEAYRASRETMAARIAQAADWARKHRVRVTMNEFGVYTRVTPPDSRARWLRDVRELAESHDIGWCMWDYAGGFRVATGEPGRRTLDRETLAALGL